MLKRICFGAALLFAISLSTVASAQSWKTTKYDVAWLPISATEVKRQVGVNAKDAVGLYYLWHRAQFQHQQRPFFAALEHLRVAQPKNGVLMAVRCAVIGDAVLKGVPPFEIAQEEFSNGERRRANFDIAKKMLPTLWLNYMTEAQLTMWEQGNGTDPKVIQQQVILCRGAVNLAPNLSFTNNALAGYLATLSFETHTSDAAAIRYYRRAQQLAPGFCGPSFGLAFHYRYNKPNAVEKAKAQQAVLATIPPGTKLVPYLRQFLLKQGITPPKS